MAAYYILIISFLFILAISLLIVGVSNDAVNFLNSAIGSKAASFNVILTVAAIGVLLGAVFSNGMMEVARKGIFNPDHFSFNEIIVIFLAVMITNLLLLDFFNTLGLPTSTTVSIVFGILGSAVAVSVYKISRSDLNYDSIVNYINIESSVLIIFGIFISVIIAFTIGTIVQWIVRLAFSFDISKTYKSISGIWGGFAITAILYFLLIKGAKGSTLVSRDMLSFIQENKIKILLISFVGWTILFQVLAFYTRINILKITVLVGTFALAMAFAGNDLVNFVGVPLAGFESFKAFIASGSTDPDGFLMVALKEPVSTPLYFLVLSGLIMVFTLRFSRKARSVTATTINLSKQSEGPERFASSSLARLIVRSSLKINNSLNKITPTKITGMINQRFKIEAVRDEKQEILPFDLVRASVNLVVASILIAFGTSLRLPLSTTYVTFMVAMGTSLSDGAWGRDSAVYRITGVLTVIGGWFFTALSAFISAFVIATIIFFWEMPAIIGLIIIASYILVKTSTFHRKKVEEEENGNEKNRITGLEVLKSCDEEVRNYIQKVSGIFSNTYLNFMKEQHKELKKLRKETKKAIKEIKHKQENILEILRKFSEADLLSGHHYVQVIAYTKEMCNSLMHIVQPAFNHLDNNHAFDREQTDQLKEFSNQVIEFFSLSNKILKNRSYEKLDDLSEWRDILINLANEIILNRIRILKKHQKGVKISLTYIEMLSETKNLLLNVTHLVKAESKLVESITESEKNIMGKEINSIINLN